MIPGWALIDDAWDGQTVVDDATLHITTLRRTTLAPSAVAHGADEPAHPGLLALAAGAATAIVGGLVLLGWATHIDALKSMLPGLVTMKPNAAACFVLFGTGLALLARPIRPWRRAGLVPIAAATLLAFATLGEYLANRSFGIDQWLFTETGSQLGTVASGRMSALTAVDFCFLGVAAILATGGYGRRLVLGLATGAIAVACLGILVVLLDGGVPVFLAGSTQMALNAALAMIVLAFGAIGLLADSPFTPVLGTASSATLMRRLLLVAVVTPLAMAWLRVEGQRAGLYGTSYGTALMVIGIVTLTVVAILGSARWAANLEQQRAVSELERDQFFELSLDMLAVFDADGRFRRANRAWLDTLGYAPDELIGTALFDLIHPDDMARTVTAAQRHFIQGERVEAFKNRYRHKDGSYRWLEWMSRMSADNSSAFAVARDVTSRQRGEARLARERELLETRNATLRKRASHDALTGLYNRRFFDRALPGIEQRWRRATADPRPPVAVVIFDLDHFGALNKQYGHQVGDAVLREFASLLKKRFRGGDLVARYGGEEFVAILEGATAADAAKVAEGVRAAFARMSVPSGTGEALRTTVSAGCAQLDGEGAISAALALADVWLAQAKRAGRNQVVGL